MKQAGLVLTVARRDGRIVATCTSESLNTGVADWAAHYETQRGCDIETHSGMTLTNIVKIILSES